MFKVGDRVIMKHHKRYYYSPILRDVSLDTGTIEKISKRSDSALIRDCLDFGFWILNEDISGIITLCA
jgi:hypothetical protein